MQLILGAFAASLVLAALGSLARVLRGPSLWDRMNGLALIGTKALMLLLVVGQLSGQPEMFSDIALAYALIGSLAMLALAKYFEKERGA